MPSSRCCSSLAAPSRPILRGEPARGPSSRCNRCSAAARWAKFTLAPADMFQVVAERKRMSGVRMTPGIVPSMSSVPLPRVRNLGDSCGAAAGGVARAAWIGTPAAPSAHERLTGIAEAYVAAIAEDDPLTATALGLPGADGRLAMPSEPARAARIARLDRWKAEIEATLQAAGSGISLVDANDARLLRANSIRRRTSWSCARATARTTPRRRCAWSTRCSCNSCICRSSVAKAPRRPTSTGPGTTSSRASRRGPPSSSPASAS